MSDPPVSSDVLHTSTMSDVIGLSDLDLSGKITIGEQVTWGGFSNISRGTLPMDGVIIEVALKTLRVQGNAVSGTKERLTKRFYREVLLWKRLQHPNIIPLVGYIYHPNEFPILISHWYINGNVIEYLQLKPNSDRHSLALDVVNGLEYLHSIQVVHGDLKGKNVLVNEDGHASLCDFGMSQLLDEASRIRGFTTTNANFGGTDRFLCPEQMLEDAPRNSATDMWALGCLVVQILTDTIPYHHLLGRPAVLLAILRGYPPMTNINNEIKRSLWDCIQNCWSVSQGHRPTAGELRARLTQAMGGGEDAEDEEDPIAQALDALKKGEPVGDIGERRDPIQWGDPIAQALEDLKKGGPGLRRAGEIPPPLTRHFPVAISPLLMDYPDFPEPQQHQQSDLRLPNHVGDAGIQNHQAPTEVQPSEGVELPPGFIASATVPSFHFENNNEYWFRIDAIYQPTNPSSAHLQLVLYRKYDDFYDFQISLLDNFPVEAGRAPVPKDHGLPTPPPSVEESSTRILPFMPGPTSYEDDMITSVRQIELDQYLGELCMLGTRHGAYHILSHPLIRSFFSPKPGDLLEEIEGTGGDPGPSVRSSRHLAGEQDQPTLSMAKVETIQILISGRTHT